MQIEHHPPAARGVSSLMYVGDAALETAIAAPTSLEMGIGVIGLAVALLTKGTPRAAGAITAAVVGLRYMRSRP